MEYSAAAAQMMADLGLNRRDVISMSDRDASGCTVRPDSGRAGVSNNASTARTAQPSTPGSSEGDEVSGLNAWKNTANFERDGVAEQLEDHGGGQSHRAALSLKLRSGAQYDAQDEESDLRYGEERKLFLRDKRNNYVASATPRKSKQERFRELARGSSTPRIVPNASSGSGNRARERGRVVSAPQNPNRARSPRSFGTVRFEPTRKQSGQPSASMSADKQAAAMLREGLTATSTTLSQGAETTIHQPVPSPNAVQNPPPGQFNTAPEASSKTEVARSQANAFDTPNQTVTGLPHNGDGAHSQVSDPPKHSFHDQLKYTKMAEYHVANPGPAADAYRKRSADRESYFLVAEKSLIKQAFYYAKNVQSQETQKYLKDNKSRQWMIDEAVKAKDFVERDALAEMDAYHTGHPHLVPFGKAAKVYFKPKFGSSAGLPQKSIPAVESDRNGGAAASTALAPAVAKGSSPIPMTNMWEVRNSTETDALSSSNDSVIFAPGSEDATSAASSQTVVARAEPAETAAASDAQQYSTSSSAPRSGCEHIENVDTAIAQPKDTGITPEFLISEMESFVARLSAMASSTSARSERNGAGASATERKLEGIKMVEDGLWVSDDE
ncbi:hypothetical protein KC363_g7088 [Hortaea werneckii]|uniref:Uncharacterized protein n=1 Tax=Hortaea werneckii TaxID=91943 RepID=A0A3M7FAS5_HORWE|nr:hypothetical protein KC325_g2615 [Hortaea werneckii]KAI6996720.1 hypothetical protein KC359_g3347 [Hortaea werneckii]KAI7147975.1 hypothetical protein KC344_g2334 [Hortaea werneckii]KAI7177513.1 hypothetical protein KC360_g2297 [Hortaea werneckii]KAI7185554.1 hypothetical protein KC363_g7088 [Hortaea werneckii]